MPNFERYHVALLQMENTNTSCTRDRGVSNARTHDRTIKPMAIRRAAAVAVGGARFAALHQRAVRRAGGLGVVVVATEM